MAPDRASPNFSPRQRNYTEQDVSLLVIHYTGMESCSAALDRLCDPAAEVSAHYVIDEDGCLHQLVAEDQKAWHAGRSYWRGISDVNDASIGIELVNPGHEWGYRPFPERQISRLIRICNDLSESYQIPPWGIVGHSDVAPGRKNDPGELFPWPELAFSGLGIWPSEIDYDPSVNPWADLALIGYACPNDPNQGSEILIPKTAEKDVVTAFQRRFLPNCMSGVLDQRTLQRIRCIAANFC